MAYDFKVKNDVEIPQHVSNRQVQSSYDFPFSDLKPGSGFFYIGRDYWTGRGMTDEEIDRTPSKEKVAGARDLRDRVKRTFGTWQLKHDANKKTGILCVDDRDKDGKYLGMNVYLTQRDVPPMAAARNDKPAANGKKNKAA